MRASPPAAVASAASCRAPAAFVRRPRPMHRRSGRSQNVSPPSTVPGASIVPRVGMPWPVIQPARSGVSTRRLARPLRSAMAPRSATSSGSNV